VPREIFIDAKRRSNLKLSFVYTEGEFTMYAVIRSGGKQYRVTPGQTLRLETLAGDAGSKIQLKDILLVENDGKLQTGSLLANALIDATIVQNDRTDKILVFKMKRKKQYRRMRGHRQNFTSVRIDKISV